MKKAKWDQENLEKVIMESSSRKEVLEKLGIRGAGSNFATFNKYIKIYNIDISHFKKNYDFIATLSRDNKIPLSKILVENSTYARKSLKDRLYEEGLKERKCEICGQGEDWQGKHMSLILDHINGIYNDCRYENLRIVCPNCNATLDTHCRGIIVIKNKEEKRKQKEKKQLDSFISRRRVERPTFEKLKEEIERLNYEGVGRKYGVSGNAVKKWIKTYQKYNI